jgi:hypothetical protein
MLDSFFALPRYPFTRQMIKHAPEEIGVYGLFEGTELIYLARANSIRASLLAHRDGLHGHCTTRASAYTWEITLWARMREAELSSFFLRANKRDPRCQGKAS